MRPLGSPQMCTSGSSFGVLAWSDMRLGQGRKPTWGLMEGLGPHSSFPW